MNPLLLSEQGRRKANRRRALTTRRRPSIEGLEDRTVMSATITAHLPLAAHVSTVATPPGAFPVVHAVHATQVSHAPRHHSQTHFHPQLHLRSHLHHGVAVTTNPAPAAVTTNPAPAPAAVAAAAPISAAAKSSPPPATTSPALLTLNVNPIDLNLLGLEVKLDNGKGGPVTVTISTQTGNGELLGNLLSDASNLVNTQGVSNALNNVLGSVVNLLNSTKLNINGVNTGGPLGSTATQTTTPVLDVFLAPIHLNLLGAVVDTSPIHLTITAHSGPGLVLGDIVTDLANLLNTPPPNGTLTLDYLVGRLGNLLDQVSSQLPGFVPALTGAASANSNSNSNSNTSDTTQVLSLSLPPINLNLLGLVLKTSQIQVNANAQSGNGALLGNLLNDLLTTLKATPETLSNLNSELNRLLGTVVNVLNASSLLPLGSLSSLTPLLQNLATANLTGPTFPTTPTPVLNLDISTNNGTPPVNVNLLGLVVTTSNIQLQLLAQPGANQILGNLVYNVANLLNPGGSLGVLSVLTALGI